MNKEYTISPGWKAFTYIVAITMVTGGIYLFVSAKPAENANDQLIGGVCWLLAGFTVYYSIRKKVTITPDSIINQGTFTRNELLKANIKGYKIEKDNLVIIAKTGKPIYISSYTTLKGDDEMLEWAAHFENIEAKEYQNDYDAMLHDEAIGNSPKERKLNVASAKKLSAYANWIAIGLAMWLLVYPYPYRYAVTTGLTYPPLVICLFYVKRDIMTFNSQQGEGSVYPSLSLALLATPLGLTLRVLRDWDLLSYTAIILPAFIIAAILGAIFLSALNGANIKTHSNVFTRFNIALFILLYSITATITINCEFDNSDALVYKTTVTDKRYTTGKNAAHYITIDKGGPLQQPTEITIGKSFYEAVHVNETIKLNAKPGLLHIPWFYVSQ